MQLKFLTAEYKVAGGIILILLEYDSFKLIHSISVQRKCEKY